jgi:hypothetical protein
MFYRQGILARFALSREGEIDRQRERINGINIGVLFVFVAAGMEAVGASFLSAPVLVLGVAALAFVVFAAVLAVSTLLFSYAGRERALALGFMTSQRNMGLMLAATGGELPDLTWLYFALSQFPIYLGPQMLKPLARRPLARGQVAPGLMETPHLPGAQREATVRPAIAACRRAGGIPYDPPSGETNAPRS